MKTSPLGTAGALSQLEPQAHPFLVMNGDLVTKAHVRAMMELCNAGVDAVMAAREYAYTVPYGCLDVDDSAHQEHSRKADRASLHQRRHLRTRARCAHAIVRADERLDMTELFRRMIDDSRDVRFHPIAEEWIDIGNREDLAWAERLFESTETPMIDGHRVIALTPARGGSKSVPYKNLHPLGGKPLLAWPIETRARRRAAIDRIIVSTDDDRIARRGAWSLAPRSTDGRRSWRPTPRSSPTRFAICGGGCAPKARRPAILVLLEATSPFRTPDADRALPAPHG